MTDEQAQSLSQEVARFDAQWLELARDHADFMARLDAFAAQLKEQTR